MLQDPDLISLQEVRTKVEKAWAAAQRFRAFSQEQVDAVVERMAEAARGHAERLAQMAVEETGYGNVKDKIAKNMLAAERLPAELRGMKTIGVLRERAEERVTEIAVPVGVVAAKTWSGFDHWAERLPFLSGCLVLLIGLAFTVRGLVALL